jgi:hypothetical protein
VAGSPSPLLDGLAILLPVFDGAIAEWDNVKELSL